MELADLRFLLNLPDSIGVARIYEVMEDCSKKRLQPWRESKAVKELLLTK